MSSVRPLKIQFKFFGLPQQAKSPDFTSRLGFISGQKSVYLFDLNLLFGRICPKPYLRTSRYPYVAHHAKFAIYISPKWTEPTYSKTHSKTFSFSLIPDGGPRENPIQTGVTCLFLKQRCDASKLQKRSFASKQRSVTSKQRSEASKLHCDASKQRCDAS